MRSLAFRVPPTQSQRPPYGYHVNCGRIIYHQKTRCRPRGEMIRGSCVLSCPCTCDGISNLYYGVVCTTPVKKTRCSSRHRLGSCVKKHVDQAVVGLAPYEHYVARRLGAELLRANIDRAQRIPVYPDRNMRASLHASSNNSDGSVSGSYHPKTRL